MSDSTSPPRRGRFRFLYQFSLRTLLLVTAGVAVFCNWYFQPKYHEEELAGRDLRVQRQVKLVKSKRGQPNAAPALDPSAYCTPLPEVEEVNHGHWTLLDGDDFVLSRGQFADGQESGHWVTYYPTGHKAAEGKMRRGVKVGPWRTWYEDGTLASEVSFLREPVAKEQTFRDYWEWAGPGGGSGIFPDKVVDPHIVYSSSREGLAKAWHRNGQLKFEGTYQADQQHGPWTFYDEQGRVTASGTFRAGKRHGEWSILRATEDSRYRLPSGTSAGDLDRTARFCPAFGTYETRIVRYVDGRTEDELSRLLGRLESQLQSKQPYRRGQALIDLAEIGQGAVPLLHRLLTSGERHEQAAILGVLPRMKDAAQSVLPVVREFSTSSDAVVAHQAQLALFQLDADSRKTLYDGLVASAIAAPTSGQSLGELVMLYRSDPKRQAAIFDELMMLPQKRTDVTSDQISNAVGGLEGDVTAHLVAACQAPSERVRLLGVKTLHAIFQWDWRYKSKTYVKFDEPSWTAFVQRLKGDSSQEVRALAHEIEEGPQRPYGGGIGCVF